MGRVATAMGGILIANAVSDSVERGAAIHVHDILRIILGVAVISFVLMALRGVLATLFYDDEDEPGHLLGDLGEHTLLLLDGIAAVMKVSVLLCLKMLVLPVL